MTKFSRFFLTIVGRVFEKSQNTQYRWGICLLYKGVRKDYLDFSNSKWKRTILKVQAATPKFPPCISIKFYAIPTYSLYFQKAIDDRLLTWNRLKYEARCFGCGKCDGMEGYTVTLPDGKKGFLCGFGLLPLPPLNAENIVEVKEALRLQDEFFKKQASA